MKDLLEKLSSYNIFNYLLPGILFSVLLTKTTSYRVLQNDIVTGVFVYYFLGLVVSRVGSLIIEPLLKKLGFIQFVDYSDFISASKKDEKIEVLSESNNMYRTFCSLLTMVSAIAGYDYIAKKYQILSTISPYLVIFLLLILFLFSYRKQTQYIEKRVKTTNLHI